MVHAAVHPRTALVLLVVLSACVGLVHAIPDHLSGAQAGSGTRVVAIAVPGEETVGQYRGGGLHLEAEYC